MGLAVLSFCSADVKPLDIISHVLDSRNNEETQHLLIHMEIKKLFYVNFTLANYSKRTLDYST